MNIQAIAIAAAITLTGFSANAATMQTVYTGTVSNSYTNGEDFFGIAAATGALDNQTFTATFVYDTSLGYAQGTAATPQLYGYGSNSPMLSAILTINGFDVSFSTGNYGTEFRGEYSNATRAGSTAQHDSYSAATGLTTVSNLYFDVSAAVGAIPADLEATFDVAATGTSYFELYDINYATYQYPRYLQGALNTTHVTVTEFIAAAPSAVPLPASLPLLAIAMGGFGFMGRRRAKNKAAQRGLS